NSQGFLHNGMVHMTLEDVGGDIDGRASARTRNAAPIADVQPIRNNQVRVGLRELFDKIPVMKPTDADTVIVHDTGLHQCKNPGAYANQIDVLVRRLLYK